MAGTDLNLRTAIITAILPQISRSQYYFDLWIALFPLNIIFCNIFVSTVQRLEGARKAAIFVRLHTPGVTNAQIAAEEGITKRYVRLLRKKEAVFRKPWLKSRAP